jgi:hypothetical protein
VYSFDLAKDLERTVHLFCAQKNSPPARQCPNGRYPQGVIATSGILYGTTWYGGDQGDGCGASGCGTVFQLKP